ncbi:MAG: SH3 domain-containing protein, partial [Gemmatimonadota bacterium]
MSAPSRSLPTTLLLAAGLLLAAPASLAGQSVATVSAEEENLRLEPQAVVEQGTEMPVLDEQGQWRRVRLEGWIWAPSVRSTSQGGFDLEVSKDGGENLRATPNGEIRARAREGMLFTRLGRKGNWFRVQREAWMWAPSLDIRKVEETGEAEAGDAGSGGGVDDESDDGPTWGGEGPDREHVVVGDGSVQLYTTARGSDSTATIYGGSDLEVLARKGE